MHQPINLPLGADEPGRLAALDALGVLDTPADAELDVITRLAADRFNTQIALVSLVDAERQWFKSRFGLAATETCRSHSFCTHAIAGEGVMVVPDASRDARFSANPLVIGPPHIRFYAGAPLVLKSGHAVGTLCVIDPAPRQAMSAHDRGILRLMASQVVAFLESREIRQRQQISDLIARTTTDAFVCADAMNRITLWNRAAEMLFGWRAEEAIGQPLALIIPDRHRAGHAAGVERLRGGAPTRLVGKTVEVPALTRDGREVPIELSLAMWPAEGSDSGEPAGFAAIMRDVSARKAAEAERAATEARDARYLAAVEASDDGIGITDAEGRFIFMNRAHAAMFGHDDPADLIGKPWSVLYDAAEARRIAEEALPILYSQGQWRGETQGRKRDGSPIEQEIALSLSPENGIVCVTRDVGERHAMEREKARLREQLMLSQRQEVVGQLASGIAHDFNNLITAIAGTAELLRGLGDPRIMPHAQRIHSAAGTAARLVEKMLTLGRKVPHPKMVDLARMVRDVRDLAAPSLADPLHRIELALPQGPVMLQTDDTELNQVLLNLVLNARDALRPGETGRIRVEVLAGEGLAPEGRLVIGRVPTVPSVLIRISDTGCGIEPEEMNKVFEPFFTRKGEAGTGLGLAVVAGVIAGNDGALAMQSWPGVGTIFEVFWPLHSERGDAAARAEDCGPLAALAGRTVLVVDDNPAVVDTLVAMLEEVGAEAGPCLDARDAIAAIRDDARGARAQWDLVITDYDMPGMNGADFARRLRKLRPGLPILLLTALPRVHKLHQKQVGLFDGVLGKPATTAQLAAAAAAAIAAARERTLSCTS
ncbi:PAS domain S-box protein [Erythrobacter sp. NE805]|uniref:hybrid sensor histidine kinase/response regulator n=1 Tax=Erythrobacter sp. NE805 TaxID=3389875 RepID=UPI00396B1C8D